MKSQLGNTFASTKVVFSPSPLKSLIWGTKEAVCTALSTAKLWDSQLQFPHSSTDVTFFFPIHILEEHHLITCISSKHHFFPFHRCLWSLLPAFKSSKNPSRDLKWVLRATNSVCREDPPVSGGFKGSLLWWTGNISSFTFSEVAAKSWVASNKEQCSVLVPSMERIWSPTCNAPHLQRKQQESNYTHGQNPCPYTWEQAHAKFNCELWCELMWFAFISLFLTSN